MAQLVARLVRNEKVGGSNPPSSTTSGVCPAKILAGQTFFGVPIVMGDGVRLFGAAGAVVQNFDLVSCRGFEFGVVIEEYIRTIR